MKGYIITMTRNDSSASLAEKLRESVESTNSQIELETFEATTPDTLYNDVFKTFGKTVPWTWSNSPEEDGMDFSLNLWKKSYQAIDQRRVHACAVSHFRLWKKCVEENETLVVLEHDALFVKKFDPKNYIHKKWGVLGLNNPIGNTRKAQRFHAQVESQGKGIHDIPRVDMDGELPLPCGLAGNSAYIIKPHAASKLLEKVEEIGMWPNDAIMCKQLFPNLLKVVYPYYTDTQRNVSTTTQL
jgi:GR25 family glycosyltransferase involved in LPS biosynthesis